MSLQQRLNRFKQQQEKCQATLVSIADQASSSGDVEPEKSTYRLIKSTSSALEKTSAATKFSSDAARLQQINAIRKVPVGAQTKQVIELLKKTMQALTAEQINEACCVDVNLNKAAFSILTNNPKAIYDGKHFLYKPKHHLTGEEQLLSLIQKFPEGLSVSDVKDAYPSVMDDIQEDIVYPNYPKLMIKVDDLKQFFRLIEVSRDMLDVEKDLLKSGMKPATTTTKRQAMAQAYDKLSKPKAMKKCRVSKKMKLTNIHLPGT